MNSMRWNAKEILDHDICGFRQYVLTPPVHLNYASSSLCEMLGVQQEELLDDRADLYAGLVHPKDRGKYLDFTKTPVSKGQTRTCEYRLLKKDGTLIYVKDTLTPRILDRGEWVGHAFFTDITDLKNSCLDRDVVERYLEQKANENRRYLQALADVYDKIFEFNPEAGTVKCIHCEDESYFKRFENIAMQLEDALEKWLTAAVDPDQQEAVRRFFVDYCRNSLDGTEGKPPQVTYSARSTTDRVNQYTGIFIKVDTSTSLFCCRRIRETEDSVERKAVNSRPEEDAQEPDAHFSDGMAAFEVTPENTVKPLYATENIREFFGYTKEEWMLLTRRYTSLERFVAYSEASYERFADLLQTGEAAFSYFDFQSETERTMKAICSEKVQSPHSSRYVLLYPVEGETDAPGQTLPDHRTVFIRTFGYFDVFVGDTPILFRSKKAKELLALLVDRRGGYITSEEAIGFLWEDEPASAVMMARYRKVALRLKNTLEEYGVSDIVKTFGGKRHIAMERVECDLYQYLSGKPEYAQLFKGSYLTNYSWGETTLGELMNENVTNERSLHER